MLFDYPMQYIADVVPHGARTPRPMRVTGSNVVEIAEAETGSLVAAMTGHAALFRPSHLNQCASQRDAQAWIDGNMSGRHVDRSTWFLHGNSLYLEGDEIHHFEEHLAKIGGISGAGSMTPLLEGGREDVREWVGDNRTERAARERAQAAARLISDGMVYERSPGPVWIVDRNYAPGVIGVRLSHSLPGIVNAGVRDLSWIHAHDRLGEAREAGESLAGASGRFCVVVGQVDRSPGVPVPSQDIEALGVLAGAHSVLHHMGLRASYMSVPLVREYCDLRETLDGIGDVHELNRLGTAGDLRRSDHLRATVERVLHGARAADMQGDDAVLSVKLLAKAIVRLDRSAPVPENPVTSASVPGAGHRRPR